MIPATTNTVSPDQIAYCQYWIALMYRSFITEQPSPNASPDEQSGEEEVKETTRQSLTDAAKRTLAQLNDYL